MNSTDPTPAAPGMPDQGASKGAPPLLGALALAALPAVLLADTLWLLAEGWQPLGLGDRAAIAALIAGTLGPFLLLALGPARRFLARTGPRLLLLATGVAIALGLAELMASLAVPKPGFHLRPAGMDRVHNTDPEIMPGIEGTARYRINSLGIRGPELPTDRSVPRVLCVGGSTTECLYLDEDEAWPRLLANSLAAAGPVWVGSTGLAGYSTVHHLQFLEEFELVREGGLDAVVLLVGVNDLWKVYLGVTEQQQLEGRAPKPVWDRMRLARLLHGWLDRVRADRGGGLEHWAVHVPPQQRQRQAGTKLERGPDLAPWLDAYAVRIERIAAACRDSGITPIFVTQPVQWAADLPEHIEARFWFGWTEGDAYVSTAVMRAGMEAFNRRLAEVAARLDAPLVDLSDLHGDPRWFFDDCHFTEAGAREVAARIAAWMLAHPQRWRG